MNQLWNRLNGKMAQAMNARIVSKTQAPAKISNETERIIKDLAAGLISRCKQLPCRIVNVSAMGRRVQTAKTAQPICNISATGCPTKNT